MKFLKKYAPVLIIPLVVLFLIAIRYLAGDHFKPGAEKNAEKALYSENIINISADKSSLAKYSFLLMGDIQSYHNYDFENYIRIDPLELLDDTVLVRIKDLNSPVLIISDDHSLAARTWMFLAQKGLRDIYLGMNTDSIEEFKYKFQPVVTE
jgi:hypothetical protein